MLDAILYCVKSTGMPNERTAGDDLRTWRVIDKKLSLQEAGKILDTTPQILSRVERGDQLPSFPLAGAIEDEVGILMRAWLPPKQNAGPRPVEPTGDPG